MGSSHCTRKRKLLSTKDRFPGPTCTILSDTIGCMLCCGFTNAMKMKRCSAQTRFKKAVTRLQSTSCLLHRDPLLVQEKRRTKNRFNLRRGMHAVFLPSTQIWFMKIRLTACCILSAAWCAKSWKQMQYFPPVRTPRTSNLCGPQIVYLIRCKL